MSINPLAYTKRKVRTYKWQFLHSDFYRSVRDAYRQTQVAKRSPFDNVFYCCTQKTASQWFRGVFDDALFFKYSGLKAVPYVELGLNYAEIREPFAKGTIATHLYIDFPTFESLPKPERYTGFFIMRDPRDLVTSWYFSAKFSHSLVWPIPEMREVLTGLDHVEGFKYIIDKTNEFGTFEAQRSWMRKSDPNVAIMRYEEFAADNEAFLAKLLEYLRIEMPKQEMAELAGRHAFSKKTQGRQQGEANVNSHYRKGVAGDWENHFNEEIMDHFRKVTGDTLEILGYEA